MLHVFVTAAAQTERTYSKLVPQEDTGRRTETNRERKNCREESHLYPRL